MFFGQVRKLNVLSRERGAEAAGFSIVRHVRQRRGPLWLGEQRRIYPTEAVEVDMRRVAPIVRASESGGIERLHCRQIALEGQLRGDTVNPLDRVLEDLRIRASSRRDVLRRDGTPVRAHGVALVVKPSDAVLERTQVRGANPAASELGKNSVGGLLIGDAVRRAWFFWPR